MNMPKPDKKEDQSLLESPQAAVDSEREGRVPVDMSPEAIDRRLRIVAELYTLGMAIQSGRFVDPPKTLR